MDVAAADAGAPGKWLCGPDLCRPDALQHFIVHPVGVAGGFFCPISYAIMRDPVLLSTGQTYACPAGLSVLNSRSCFCCLLLLTYSISQVRQAEHCRVVGSRTQHMPFYRADLGAPCQAHPKPHPEEVHRGMGRGQCLVAAGKCATRATSQRMLCMFSVHELLQSSSLLSANTTHGLARVSPA